MSAWARAPARGLEPIKAEQKEHYGDSSWEDMYLPQFEPDVSFTKSIRDRVPSSQYGRLVPVVQRPEKVEEVVDGTLRLPKETEALRKQVLGLMDLCVWAGSRVMLVHLHTESSLLISFVVTNVYT